MKPLRCLLAGPVPGHDGESGDVQYVRDLLGDPPPGVTYVTYVEALESGELRDAPSLNPRRRAPRTLPEFGVAVARTGLYAIRRTGLLLPDPVRWWQVAGDFDVIHSHCFALRLVGPAPPVVATDSAGTFWYWTAAQGRDERQVWRQLRRERRLARALGYVHPSVTPDLAEATLYFVGSGRDLASRVGADVTGTQVAPAGVPDAGRRSPKSLSPPVLLFVARNFEIKGGPDALAALALVRAEFPDCQLWIAGPDLPQPEVDGVTWLGPLSRSDLYRDVYPAADLFMYPTRFDVAPLVVVEALAHGLPVVAPRRFGLPDLVKDGETGVLVDSGGVEPIADAVLGLLRDPDRLRRMGTAAARDFEGRLSVRVRNDALGAAYRDAVGVGLR